MKQFFLILTFINIFVFLASKHDFRTYKASMMQSEYVIYVFTVPPPSYESLFGQVRKARKNSDGVFSYAKNLLILLLGTGTYVDVL